MPPKPTLDIDISEFRHMRSLMIKVQDRAKEIKHLQDKVLPDLKQQLAETKGIFKGKERKALEIQIQQTEREIADKLDKIPDTLKADGYPDVQVFMATYRKAEPIVEQYNRDLAEWERQVKEKGKPNRPLEKESVRDRHRASSKEHERSPKTENDNFDIEHDTTRQNLCLAEFHISLKYLSNFTKNPYCQFVSDSRDCCKCDKHTDMILFCSFLSTVNRCSDYACSAHKEKCNPKCHMAVVAGPRRLCIVIYHCFRIQGKCYGYCSFILCFVGNNDCLCTLCRIQRKLIVCIECNLCAVYFHTFNIFFRNGNRLCFTVGLAVFNAGNYGSNAIKHNDLGINVCYIAACVGQLCINNILVTGVDTKHLGVCGKGCTCKFRFVQFLIA